jgi:hypothetical protein
MWSFAAATAASIAAGGFSARWRKLSEVEEASGLEGLRT